MNRTSLDNRYRELVVMTRPLQLSLDNNASPGHAMIAISTEGHGVEAWGFYLDTEHNGIHVRDEIEKGQWGRYDTSSVIPISSRQYQSIIREIERWKKKKYILAIRDCTDFVLAMLKAAEIAAPRDTLWPSNLGDRMTGMHGAGGGRCIGNQPEGARPPVLPWRL